MKHLDSPSAVFTVAEFFAGVGLVRMGLERYGGKIVYANDIDPQKLQMYSTQFPDSAQHFVLDNIHNLDFATIPSVDLATASFPCTDLSLAGSRVGLQGAQSSAFWGFIDALRGMKQRPSLVMLENVTGFLTSHGGRDFESAMIALNGLGYVVDPFVLDAAWFVPQSRQRLFVVGKLGSPQAVKERPAGQYGFYENRVRPKALANFILTHPGIAWGIRDLPEPPATRANVLDDFLEDIPDSAAEWWSAERSFYLLGQMSNRHRAEVDQMITASKISFGTVFRRVRNGKSMAELRTDGIAGCLRTPKGGSGRQILVKCGLGRFQARLLTARECARLMGAGEYKITVPMNQALFGFGDAVCVDVIAWIASNYLVPVLAERRAA